MSSLWISKIYAQYWSISIPMNRFLLWSFRFLVYREFITDKKSNKNLLVSQLKCITCDKSRFVSAFLNKKLFSFWQKIIEKFRRNEKIPFHENILKRTFDIAGNKIILQFHYGKDDITPQIRVYTCPARPDYGCEILFNEEDNPVDEVPINMFSFLCVQLFYMRFCCD